MADPSLSIDVAPEIARDLAPLRAALVAAGLPVGALGTFGGRLHTYDASGAATDFPGAIRAQVANAVRGYAPVRPAPPDFGAEVPDNAAFLLADRVAQLRAFLDTPNASITLTTVIVALKLLTRVVLWRLRGAI